MLCGLIVVLIAGFVLLPSLHLRNRAPRVRISCVNNLKMVGLSFRIYANDHDDRYPMMLSDAEGGARESLERDELFRVFLTMSNELAVPRTVRCAADSRPYATNWTGFSNTNISYFLGLDAVDTKPNMILGGDRNLAIDDQLLSGQVNLGTNSTLAWTRKLHREAGNFVLADGSVQQFDNQRLRQRMSQTGDATNRVLFPQ